MDKEECTPQKLLDGQQCTLNTNLLGFSTTSGEFSQSLGSAMVQIIGPQILLPVVGAAAFGMIIRRLRN